MAQIISGADGTVFSSWTTAGRPASPTAGQTGYNSTLGLLETYNGSSWIQGGGGLWASVQTSNFAAVAGYSYPVNTTSGAVTVTLPASPTAGQTITLADYAGTWDTNNCIVDPNGLKINGTTLSGYGSTERQVVVLVYIDSTQGWISCSQTVLQQAYSVQYVVIAGGGGGGSPSGGGGAGGYRSSVTGESSGGGGAAETPLSITPGVAYTITVGAGGAGNSYPSAGFKGTNSSISGTGITTVTSLAGGAGTHNGLTSDSNGGAGGGGGYSDPSGGTGTSGQGYAGGGGQNGGGYPGGGGGGAGSAGSNAPSTGQGGNGGSGVTSAISGSSVGRAGGGGGGVRGGSGSSATDGGGAGTASGSGNAGTVNTGGGGGGGGWSGGLSGAGGSGVVILRYLGSQRGSGGTVTSAGGYTIHTFNTSGTYTG